MRLRSHLLSCAALLACGCTTSFGAGPISEAPDRPDEVDLSPPKEEAPTGSKWAETEETDACGRTQRVWVLVDEVCAGTSEPDYLEHFRTPMFRDGIRIEGTLFTVDGTHVWIVGADDLRRKTLTAYPGHPIAVERYKGRLLVAAADAGLLMLDVSSPERPKIIDEMTFEGPAMGVRVDGDMAWVATGADGIVGVELGKAEFGRTVTTPIPSGSFAAAAEHHGRLAYVAACDRLAIIDPVSGETIGEVWFSIDVDIPARDVAVVGDVAFVAAGKTGAVAIDVSDPTDPRIMGNCLVRDERYYASGVRTDGKRVYVAGGEWGVQIIDVTDPRTACQTLTLPEDEEPEAASCEEAPPWEVIDWEISFDPPEPAKDPIGVRVDGDRLYAFGDARRIGLRSVDVWDVSLETLPEIPDSRTNDWLTKLGRYEEPHLVHQLVASDDRVLVTGDGGGLFQRSEEDLLVPVEAPDELRSARAAHFLRDGRWAVVSDAGELLVEDFRSPIATGLEAESRYLAQEADGALIVGTERGFQRFDLESSNQGTIAMHRARLPASMTVHSGEVIVAAPEWTRARKITGTELEPHGVFDEDDIMDVTRWRSGVPRRLLTSSSEGLVELAALGSRASLVVHREAPERTALPPGDYAGLAASGDYAYAVAHDRGLYRSQLLVIDLATSEVIQTIAFTGVTTSLDVAGDRLYVGDADDGIAVFDISAGLATRLGHVNLEVPDEMD